MYYYFFIIIHPAFNIRPFFQNKNIIFLSHNKEKIEALLTYMPWGALLYVIKQTECGHLILL